VVAGELESNDALSEAVHGGLYERVLSSDGRLEVSAGLLEGNLFAFVQLTGLWTGELLHQNAPELVVLLLLKFQLLHDLLEHLGQLAALRSLALQFSFLVEQQRLARVTLQGQLLELEVFALNLLFHSE